MDIQRIYGCEIEIFAALETIRQIADDLDQPLASVVLAWVMHQPGITSLLVGARKPEEVEWNLPVVNLKLADDMATKLAQATALVKEKLGNNPDMWFADSRMR
ncbi:aldo/keto reductase [Chloroflexi bacterium TSY]|nr:aldo/keto reductase [Chloroflexi bacterium TSY]